MKTLLWKLQGKWLQWRNPLDVDAVMADFKPRYRRCPTPAKIAYSSMATAVSASNVSASRGFKMRAYRCPCGWYHLASRCKR